jgi:CRISPR-associated protein Csh1
MILDIIKDNIKHDDKNKNDYSIYENEIKEKLNLLFSIKHHFKNGGEKMEQGEFIRLKEKMSSYLGYWQDKKNEKDELVLKDDGKPKKEFVDGVDNIENDDEFFAFLCGQIARFLIGKKKGKEENKTHSDFSAFTDWQTSKLLKEYIYEVHKKYAHELKFYKRYDNAMSIIQTYKGSLNMDNVMEYMVAGYFAKNQILNQTQENENE